jgi:pimeloyl-ACP methyl ester carboxylesterase
VATIVLAHGAWSSAWAWKKVRPLMAASGHQFFAPSYTGLGERAHLAAPTNDLETHIQDVMGVIDAEELNNFILIGHSYGGMVATAVADRARGRVAHLIYLDGFVPKDGQSLVDLLPPEQRKRLLDSVKTGDGWRVQPNPTQNDTSPEDQAWVMKHRVPQSVKCFDQPVGLQGEITVPRSFIQCLRYGEHGPFGQFAERAKKESGWALYPIDASHSPNVTAPDLLMKTLNQIIAGVRA